MRHSIRHRLIALVIALFVALSAFSGAVVAKSPAKSAPGKVHSFLEKLAKQRPNEKVEVIVQMGKGQKLKDSDLGPGAIKKRDLTLISSHVLQLPVKAALQLADRSDVRFVSYNSPLVVTSTVSPVVYPQVVGVTSSFWADPAGYTGKGIGVAVLDTGVADHPDLAGKVVHALAAGDGHGHGTHVAGVIAGRSVDAAYVGVAPGATIYSVKSGDNAGNSTEADLIAGLEWIVRNHREKNIRVVNISASTSVPQSYLTSPISAMIELLWLRGVVVVVSAGNRGDAADAMWYSPANDPFVITVGAVSDNGTADRGDDYLLSFSSRGKTQYGLTKPDVTAPGHRIVAPMAAGSLLGQQMPERIENGAYIRLSGTSMSAPMVSGLAAVILSKNPDLTPNQVKWLITNKTYGENKMVDAGAIYGYLSSEAKVPAGHLAALPSLFLAPLFLKFEPARTQWPQAYWDNLLWEQHYWDNLLWEQHYWDNLLWEQHYWDNLLWEQHYWDNLLWEQHYWDNLLWEQHYWDNLLWEQHYWDQHYWDQHYWDQHYWDQHYWDMYYWD